MRYFINTVTGGKRAVNAGDTPQGHEIEFVGDIQAHPLGDPHDGMIFDSGAYRVKTAAELANDARAVKKKQIKAEATNRASAIYGVPISPELYDFYADMLQSTTNFNPANLSIKLQQVKAIRDVAVDAYGAIDLIADDVGLIMAYDVKIDPGW
jgi:hypothetical protein